MKHYQDADPLHGHGKAIPHPNRPINRTVRILAPAKTKWDKMVRAMTQRIDNLLNWKGKGVKN